jgi:hypothetical protein
MPVKQAEAKHEKPIERSARGGFVGLKLRMVRKHDNAPDQIRGQRDERIVVSKSQKVAGKGGLLFRRIVPVIEPIVKGRNEERTVVRVEK